MPAPKIRLALVYMVSKPKQQWAFNSSSLELLETHRCFAVQHQDVFEGLGGSSEKVHQKERNVREIFPDGHRTLDSEQLQWNCNLNNKNPAARSITRIQDEQGWCTTAYTVSVSVCWCRRREIFRVCMSCSLFVSLGTLQHWQPWLRSH